KSGVSLSLGLADPSFRQRRGSRSIHIGAPIQFVLIAWHAVSPHGAGHRLVGRGGMTHKYSVGQIVYFEGTFGHAGAGQYEIVRLLPIEQDNRLIYRIKSVAEGAPPRSTSSKSCSTNRFVGLVGLLV